MNKITTETGLRSEIQKHKNRGPNLALDFWHAIFKNRGPNQFGPRKKIEGQKSRAKKNHVYLMTDNVYLWVRE